MDEFGMLAKDFGFRPQGKSAPMKSIGGDRRSRHSPSSATFSADGKDIFNDVFGGPPKYTNSNSKSTSSMSDFDYDSIFKDSVSPSNNEAKTKPTSSNSPVYDKPVYDDDIFDGLPGIKSTPVSSSSPGRYDDNIWTNREGHFDDLFSSFGRTEKAQPNKNQSNKSPGGFDDLIPGFGSGSPASGTRWNSDPSPKSASKRKEKSNAADDPFAVLESMSTPVASASSQGLFTDPLEQISRIGKSKSTKKGGDVFGDIDSLNGFNKSSSPSSAKETNNRGKGQKNPSEEGSSIGSARSSIEESFSLKSPFEDHQSVFDMPAVSRNSPTSHTDTSSQAGPSPKSEENDIWLTVSEIPLFTPVTKAPPPSRPPPPIPSPRQPCSPLDELENFVREKEHTNASRSKEADREEREKERTREKTRQAVERATREARERAASEARLKSERAAVQRAQAEARERAAVEAKGRAERAAAEARERASEAREKEAREKAAVAKAQAEARRRAERAAVERVTAEARERAAAEARDKAAAAAVKVNQQKNDNDLDSFFNMGSRPNSVPKSRTSSDSATDPVSQERRAPEVAHRASSSAGAPSSVRKTSPTTNFVDDLSSIFGGGEFQDVEGGETDERRRANMERDQRIEERVAKALAEKNERDMQSQKEQEERQRISATLDVEIKRWAAGKEGNLRAMLSTLQYVLWPECGWQAVSLTDLISGASVKKAYRKATLCIHPDKVQQKGATLQQKYVAEKVFDLLKEAWNKFNSEELF